MRMYVCILCYDKPNRTTCVSTWFINIYKTGKAISKRIGMSSQEINYYFYIPVSDEKKNSFFSSFLFWDFSSLPAFLLNWLNYFLLFLRFADSLLSILLNQVNFLHTEQTRGKKVIIPFSLLFFLHIFLLSK